MQHYFKSIILIIQLISIPNLGISVKQRWVNQRILITTEAHYSMLGDPKDISIDSDITYSLKTNSFNKSLKLANHSPRVYVFKIKTNQKTVVSLQLTHDFIQPNSVRQIAIKLADKPSQTGALKLQFNYAVAHEEDIANRDSKMNSYPKENVFKKIITVQRRDNAEEELRLSNRSQKIQIQQVQKSFASPLKIQSRGNDVQQRYPSVELTKSQVRKITNISQKSAQINIADLIKPEKGVQNLYLKKEEQPLGKDSIRQTPKKVQLISDQPLFQKVHSNFSQKKSQNSQLDSSVNIFVSMPAENNEKSTFRMTESVLVQVSPDVSNQVKEKQSEISKLNEKIEKQRKAIKSLQSECQKQSSMYPFALILGLIMASFCVGSCLNWCLSPA